MTPTELHTYLIDHPGTTYGSLSTEARTLLRQHLRSHGGFTEQQQAWLYGDGGFWLVATPARMAAIQAALPKGLALSGRVPSVALMTSLRVSLSTGIGVSAELINSDDRLLSASLLTDCLEPGDTWHAIAPLLAQLPIVHDPEMEAQSDG
jgi:hypothetical protein